MHFKRESSERRLYSLRDQLKVQFRATQKAQVSERKEASSKRRLTSYIFHEVSAFFQSSNVDTERQQVRVPLNTACRFHSNLLELLLDFNFLM